MSSPITDSCSSAAYVATPSTSQRWNDGTIVSPRSAASRLACSTDSWKSCPWSTRSAPRARIAAFLSGLFDSGATIVTGTPSADPAKAMLWPWLPRVAAISPTRVGSPDRSRDT